TIDGNSASVGASFALDPAGGGIYSDAYNVGLGGVTLNGNSTDVDGTPDGAGGNVYLGDHTLSHYASIISGGSGAAGSENCLVGGMVSLAHSTESTADQCGMSASDLESTDPMLAPALALNGAPAGSPMTRALLPGSPAIDLAPDDSSCAQHPTDE